MGDGFKLSLSLPVLVGILACSGKSNIHVKGLPDERRQLNYAYAQLYHAFKGLQWTDELLLFKKESDKVDALGTELTRICKDLQETMDELKEKYPALDYSDFGQPKLIRKKNLTVQSNRAWESAPLIGKKGRAFERSLLIGHAGALNELIELAKVVVEEEPEAGLRSFWKKAENELTDIKRKIETHLEKAYFK